MEVPKITETRSRDGSVQAKLIIQWLHKWGPGSSLASWTAGSQKTVWLARLHSQSRTRRRD